MATSVRTARFDIVNGKQIALLVAPPFCFLLASVAVGARWYTRKVKRLNTVVEDALCLAALAMSFVVITMVYILVFLCGEGLTGEQIKNDPTKNYAEVERYWLRMQFALDICWATSVTTVQVAFLNSYVRLYEGRKHLRRLCYTLMVLAVGWYIWAVIGWVHFCHPPGKCVLQKKTRCIVIGSLHVFANAVLLFTPLPAVFAVLQYTSRKRKLCTMALFMLGCFCTILAALRIDCAINVFGDVNKDKIGASWWRICFSPIEVAAGIICCCVPNVSPLSSLRHDAHAHFSLEAGLHKKGGSFRSSGGGGGLRRHKFRSHSVGSSTSNLNPVPWVPGPMMQVNAFVGALEKGRGRDRSLEKGGLGQNEIQVTREYELDRL